MYSEYVGLEQDVASLIESNRIDPSETKNAILRRILPASLSYASSTGSSELDLGQGVRLPVGERLYLYLTKPNDVRQTPDGVAEIKEDGLYAGGKRFEPVKGRILITPPMKMIQREKNHFNKKGELISLSAYRQWHVIRNDLLVPLEDLKDSAQRRTRITKVQKVDVEALLTELGIK